MIITQNKDEWLAAVAELGGVVDTDGDNVIVARSGGRPIGYWDKWDSGFETGVIYETGCKQA